MIFTQGLTFYKLFYFQFEDSYMHLINENTYTENLLRNRRKPKQ